EAYSTPLDKIDVAIGERFRDNTMWPFFERLRHEDPVHFTAESEFGPYWSVTRYHDIVAIETNHAVFSSARAISIAEASDDFELPMFIAMDPPKHDAQRKVISPIVSPHNLVNMEPIIRERAGKILDELPIGEEFDWVDRVSIELTTQMLATLFDFPFEERRKLTYWSDLATTDMSDVMTEDEARAELLGCGAYFQNLWNVRQNGAPANDLISMLAHGEATRDMPFMEFLGNILLLIVGGNDTTRNSITGGLYAFSQSPDQYARVHADPSLIVNMVPEIIRWQTPVAHMRRTALADIEFGGNTIRKGEKVVMWYVSGNRDETAIDNPDAFIIDRPRPRQHLSFGFGIHRCVGNRLAEMQLRIVWEEILKRFPAIEVVEEPVRLKSCFLRAYRSMTVRIPSRI
ncbi:MAG TPA: cytochrome P450, partial [Caulobacteraceae bacterium]|nr:cytochrome P450 [Caulobacteraceae bacterium]